MVGECVVDTRQTVERSVPGEEQEGVLERKRSAQKEGQENWRTASSLCSEDVRAQLHESTEDEREDEGE